MGVMDYFKPVSTCTADKAREFISRNDDGTYNFVDAVSRESTRKGTCTSSLQVPFCCVV